MSRVGAWTSRKLKNHHQGSAKTPIQADHVQSLADSGRGIGSICNLLEASVFTYAHIHIHIHTDRQTDNIHSCIRTPVRSDRMAYLDTYVHMLF